ncbi:MAG: hypothetical protein ACPLTQ_09335 [Anaerolineae bacterium]
MTTLTLQLPHQLYQQLCEQADRLGKPPQLLVQEWLAERLGGFALETDNERAKVKAALRVAGLLGGLTPALRRRANPTVSLEEIIVYQSRLQSGEPLRTYLLRVFVDLERFPPEVVTVYRTSKVAKYWREEA